MRVEVAERLAILILMDIEEPIYKEHPSLKPDGLDGPYRVDPRIFEPRFYEWNP